MVHSTRFLVLAGTIGLLAACSERSISAPTPTPTPDPDAPSATALRCSVHVPTASMTCEEPARRPMPGGLAAKILGGQDIYVRLTSTGTSYSPATQTFSTTVGVQNLTRHVLGAAGGITPAGVRVFFETLPHVTDGTGTITVANPDGVGTFTGSGQPYFQYATTLPPLQLSDGRLWQFSMPATVISFAFAVYVEAPMSDEDADDLRGPVWTGAIDSVWFNGGNWDGGVVPDESMPATVPAAAMLEGPTPALSGDGAVLHLRVSDGSTIDLGTRTLAAGGNVDVLGAVTGGTLEIDGTDVRIGGALPALQVDGSASLQRPVTTSGRVIVNGRLVVEGKPLIIHVP